MALPATLENMSREALSLLNKIKNTNASIAELQNTAKQSAGEWEKLHTKLLAIFPDGSAVVLMGHVLFKSESENGTKYINVKPLLDPENV